MVEKQDNFIIEFDHVGLTDLMERIRSVTDNCGIPLKARQEFANRVLKLLKTGKAFNVIPSAGREFMMQFRFSEKLIALFDKAAAA